MIRFHDLRHTAATLLLREGVFPKYVQELFGHANIAITLDTYSHVLPGMGDQAARALENALDQPVTVRRHLHRQRRCRHPRLRRWRQR